ncbi:hypothetical protein V2A60_009847 [Cordyceps javanica]
MTPKIDLQDSSTSPRPPTVTNSVLASFLELLYAAKFKLFDALREAHIEEDLDVVNFFPVLIKRLNTEVASKKLNPEEVLQRQGVLDAYKDWDRMRTFFKQVREFTREGGILHGKALVDCELLREIKSFAKAQRSMAEVGGKLD